MKTKAVNFANLEDFHQKESRGELMLAILKVDKLFKQKIRIQFLLKCQKN